MRRKICLAPKLANLLRLEEFIRECPFLDSSEKSRALLVTTEYFDNIVRYSKCWLYSFVSIEVSHRRKGICIRIGYRTRNFGEMIAASDTTTPHYDIGSLRYRGLGLLMCKNIASSIRYRSLLFKSFIIINL